MYFKLNTPVKIVFGLLTAFFLVTAAQAVMPEPLNPMDVANMNFDQRLALMKKVDDAQLKSTSQERTAFWKKFSNQVMALSPSDTRDYYEKMQATLRSATPAQKNAMLAERKAYFEALSSDEQAAVRTYLVVNEMNINAAK
jgi:iron uptake system EfeUOB component EfeO/EfeM